MCLVLLLRILGLVTAATSETCRRQRHGRDAAAAGGLANADTVFSGTILELFPGHHATSGGGHPGVVRVRSVYKGDPGIERFPVVVEGFGSPEFCWKPSRKVQKTAEEFGSQNVLLLIEICKCHISLAKLTFLRNEATPFAFGGGGGGGHPLSSWRDWICTIPPFGCYQYSC